MAASEYVYSVFTSSEWNHTIQIIELHILCVYTGKPEHDFHFTLGRVCKDQL